MIHFLQTSSQIIAIEDASRFAQRLLLSKDYIGANIPNLQRGDERQLNKHENDALAEFKNDVSELVSAEAGDVHSYIWTKSSRQPKVQ